MKDWRRTLVSPSTSIVNTLKLIDASALQIALVVDSENKLLGTVTDGDIRRGILNGVSLEKPVAEVMKKDPIVAGSEQKREDILEIMKKKLIYQMPVVDEKGCVVRLELLGSLIQTEFKDNPVLIMAGGFGTRLKPFTSECPKPLLKVGDKPLLETILNSFAEQGFKKFYFSVNYMAEKIKDYFGDGTKWDVEIQYIIEEKRMGTAGALGLLPTNPEKPLFVMNGDLLTKVNYNQLLDFHHENRAQATMCVREYSMQIPYGIVKINGNRLLEINEKPVHNFFVNAGIYVLEPEVLDLVPKKQFFDMTTLFDLIIDRRDKAAVFPIREYWIDIGHHEDLEKANTEYGDNFN